ncbi:MAG: site-2 protease family protein [Deltaproteobacteria bacterium]|nr:site-2 protease family protein [Deltaproteobacteria bacterium]MDQ3298983.1 site-2 protease family protein [Myxococcota bacterium]
MSVVYFLLLVGVLVVIHELGHFVAAKLLDVKVLRFSIGYGRPLVRVTLRETEYQIGAFPIGGYVRILGVEGDPDEKTGTRADAGRSFASRPLWQRLVIVFAGPVANLVLPVIIYFVFFAGHSMLPAAVIGDVLEGGAAARAGIEPGDRVLEIDGTTMRYWEEIEDAVRSAPGKELHLRISRNGKVFERYVSPLEETVRSRDGRVVVQGRVGVTHSPFVPLVGIIDGESPAARSGLQTGDLIISVDGQPVRNWTDVKHALGRFARRTSIVYFRGTELPGVPQIHLLAAGFADLLPETQINATLKRQIYTGLEHAEMFVAQVDPGSPADSAGLQPGDLIVALDDKPVVHWLDLDQRLQAEPTKPFKVTWKRAVAGKTETMSTELTQVWRKQLDAYDHTVSRLVFGARNDVDRGRGAMVAIDGRFGYALTKALERTGETISTMTSGFTQILAGDTPGEALGGPLMMYRVASVSGNQGWDSFLLMLALISVNLGLINLLPIPMLDGGHLLVFAIEGARRRPISAKTRERVQLAGLIVVGLITILALRNDVMRFFFR